MIVADANLIAYLLIPGEKTGLAEEIFRKDLAWAVPLICQSEVRNILALYMRHERMSLVQAKQTMELAENLWRSREYAVPSDDVLDLAAGHKITAYDAEFVVLARELNVPLVTFDKPLQKAFPKVTIVPEKFLRI